MTKYSVDGKRYAVSWIQLDIFGKSYCFSKKQIAL